MKGFVFECKLDQTLHTGQKGFAMTFHCGSNPQKWQRTMQDWSELGLIMFWDCFVMVKNMLGGRKKLKVILSNVLVRDKHDYLAGKISVNVR